MSIQNKVLLLVHPDEELRARLARALGDAGGRVMQAADDGEAWERVQSVFEPDVVIAHLPPRPSADESPPPWIGERVRGLSGAKVAVVALAEQRRDAYRRGFVHVVGPPFDEEEVVLVTIAGLEPAQRDGSLSGDLAQMSIPDLLQTASINGQSAHVVLRRGPRSAELWLRDGRVVDARIDAWGGEHAVSGRQAVYKLVSWEDGSFAVEFGPVTAPERISEPTTHLVLEAMRRLDEERRHAEPGHAQLPEDPPLPTATQKADHLTLLLLNVAASWLSDHLAPGLLARMVEEARGASAASHAALRRFRVDGAGRVSLDAGAGEIAADAIEPLAAGVAAWLEELFDRAEKAMPGRFSLARLAVMTGAHHEDLVELGFVDALGWSGLVAAGADAASESAPDLSSPDLSSPDLSSPDLSATLGGSLNAATETAS